ncbi:MAG: Ig-like domain-containing protein [Acidimicrobiia bacterium]|nr:Ig-like domain-containing protein [Acidimicrobiia bacterium]
MANHNPRRAQRPRLLTQAAQLAATLKTLAEGHPEGHDPQPRSRPPKPAAPWYQHLGRPLILTLTLLLITATLVYQIDDAQAATAPSIVASSLVDGTPGNVTSIDISNNGAAENDLMLVHIARDGTDNAVPPAGWNLLRRDALPTSYQAIYWRIAGASEPANATWSFTDADSNTVIWSARIDNADTSTPIGANDVLTGNFINMDAPSVAATTTDSLLLTMYLGDWGNGGYTPHTGMTENADRMLGFVSLYAASETITSTTPTGIRTATADNPISHDNLGVSLIVNPVPPPANIVTVNSTGDTSDLVAGDDVCDTGGIIGSDPECTLRAAIEEANASATVDTIHFDIPQTDGGYTPSPVAFTVEPGSVLPDITTSMTIDGTTQTEYGTSGRPVVEVTGTSAGGNADGFRVNGGSSTIRGLVVNNWDDEGFALTSDGNSILGNYIGTDVTGSSAEPNKIGVVLRGTGNTIGGSGADGNLVSGNTNQGIMVTIGGSSTEIVGNLVGTDASGSGAIPNGRGIDLNSAGGALVGGTAPSAANTVAYNTSYGVAVTGSSTGNSILGNAIHSNGGLGIDHNEDGVTSNDAGDGDTGQNDFLNYPVITSATESGGTITVDYDLDVPDGSYRIEFFTNSSGADPSGNGEGETYADFVDVTVTGGVPTPPSTTLSGSAGDVLTATATEGTTLPFGSTSEFSTAYAVTPAAPAFGPGGVTADLGLWLRADAGVSTSGADVTAWGDQSGNGNDATQATPGLQPDFIAGAVNGNPVIDFDGTDDVIGGTAGASTHSFYVIVVPDTTISSASPAQNIFAFDCAACVSDTAFIAFGNTTGTFPDEVVTHGHGGSAAWRVAQTGTATYPDGVPVILASRSNAALNGTDIYADGLEVDNAVNGAFLATTDEAYNVAAANPNSPWPGEYLDGKIAEVISYSTRATDAEHQRIQSYLAIKYGLTLDQTTPYNYVRSDGTVIWDATVNTSYKNDIAGIGQDDAAALDQTASRSVSADSIVNITTASSQGDGDFLVWGNDDGATTWTTTGSPFGERLQRTWRVDETGDVGTATVALDVGALTPPSSDPADFHLLIDADGDFTTGATDVVAASYAGGVATFNLASFNDGDYFTLAVGQAGYSISGTVFEDVAGDVLNDGTIGDASNPGAAGVDVYLYEDTNGNGVREVGIDTLVAGPIQTDGSGNYSFGTLSDDDYYVVVDSTTVASSQDPGATQGDIWAEQTYGAAGSICANGGGSANERGTSGPCYGGMGVNSDSMAFPQHWTWARVAGADISNVDFGFSFNVVTSTRGGDNTDDDGGANRTVQGSLRQFIQNANAISGANSMRFVPVEPTNDGTWWAVSVSNALPPLTDAGTTIDGTAFDLGDGTTLRDTNAGFLGANAGGGVLVGVDNVALPQVAGPELEIQGDQTILSPPQAGFVIQADSTTVRRLAIYGFGDHTTAGSDANIQVGPSGGPALEAIVIEQNVIGTAADGFADPGLAARTDGNNILVTDAISGGPGQENRIRDNLIGFAYYNGVMINTNTGGWLVTGNEIRAAGLDNASGPYMDTLAFEGTTSTGHSAIGNYITQTDGPGIDTWRSPGNNTIENNTLIQNGSGGAETAGLRIFGTGSTVSKNVITNNTGPGVIVVGERPVTVPTWSAASGNLISQNTFGTNTGISIDLVESTDLQEPHGQGDGVTLTAGTLATTGNNGLDAPAISSAIPTTVSGTSCGNCDVEVYRAVAGAGDDSGGTDYGEGIEYLGTATANGSGDWTLTGITALSAGDEVSAITSDGSNNTSEFSANSTVACADTDLDGLCDLEEDANTDADNDPTTNPGPDTDGDLIPNYLDDDDDGDGTPTASENADPNGDGDPRDALDSDSDGQPDYLDAPITAHSQLVEYTQKISDTDGGLVVTNLSDDDFFGSGVASIGDLDGDGVADFVVGSVGDDDGGPGRGAVYVLFLNADGTVKGEQKISDITGGLSAVLDDDDKFGREVAGIGDLDGDGINDIAVGASGDDDGATDSGAVHILFLNANGTVKAEQKISDTAGGFASSLDTVDNFGSTIAPLGDLDGDGVRDIVVGALNDDDGGTNRGAAYILFLNSNGTVKTEQKISDTAGGFGGVLSDDDRFARGVAGLGDIDGDGTPDVIIGVERDDDGGTDRGAAYVLFLNPDGTVKAEQKISDTAGAFSGGLDDDDWFGRSVAGIGDYDGDGVPDAAVGALRDDSWSTDGGAVYLLALNTDGTVKSDQRISAFTAGFNTFLEANDNFGVSVSGLGDFDSDGDIDIIVAAASDDDGGTNRGAVYVVALTDPCANDADADGLCDYYEDANTDGDGNPATNSGPNTDGDGNPNYLDSDDDGDTVGTSAENADPNGDGDPRDAEDADRDAQPDYLDLPTSASDGTVADEQLISETLGGLAPTLGVSDHFGRAIAPIGDLDGDGVNDIAVGAPNDDDGSSDRGAVYILFMNGNGTVKGQQKISDTDGGFNAVLDNADEFGIAVTGLGDLDGDGVNDIAVGAHQDDDGANGNGGAVYVLLLNANGTVKASQKISETDGGLGVLFDANDRFGGAVATIGDLDGDGLNDIVVGSKDDDDGFANAGAVYVLFLNADGTVKGSQKISQTTGGLLGSPLGGSDGFGIGVAGLGDVDGDGNGDIAVGTYWDDDGGTNHGAAYVLFLDTDGTVKGQQKISDTEGAFTGVLQSNDEFGTAVGAAGDLDADGVPDLIVGTPKDDDGNSLSGAAYVLFLNSNGTVKSHQKISNLEGGLSVTINTSDQFGFAVAGIGDLDGDGTIGIAVGVFGDDDGFVDSGSVYILDLGAPNGPPTAVPGGPYSTDEGEDLILDGSASSDPDTDPLTYNWDIDNDGQYDDATGDNPTIPWLTLVGLGFDDDGGPYPIGLEVDDGNGNTDTATVNWTIANTAPTISVTGTGTIDAGSIYTVNLSVTDPGDDTVTGWVINWGDGSVSTIAGNPASFTHTYDYAEGGLTYPITAAVADEDSPPGLPWHQNMMVVPGLFATEELFRLWPTTGAIRDNIGASTGLGWTLAATIGPNGLLYVGDYTGDRILEFNPVAGVLIREFVTFQSGALDGPAGMRFGPDGHLYVSSNFGDQILKFHGTSGAPLGVFAGGPELDEPDDLVFGPDGYLYVSSFNTDQVLRYNGITGVFVDVFATGGGLNAPSELTFGPDGHLYVTSVLTNEVLKYNGSTGSPMGVFASGGGIDEPRGAIFGPDGHLYVGGRNKLVRYTGTGGGLIGDYVGVGPITGPAQSAFVPEHQVAVNRLPFITGTVFEDINGDLLLDGSIGSVANPGAPGVDVHLYDGTNTLVQSVVTDAAGGYTFHGLADDTYTVRVDSRTVPSAQDPAAVQGDIWAVQTYGPDTAPCANGAGSSTPNAGSGSCYGGITGAVSDSDAFWNHRVVLTISGSGYIGIDFGFSFNVVTNTRGGDLSDDDLGANRTVQGSLRQFIQNANAISGSNVMRFVPVEPSNASQVADQWWRIDVTNVLDAISDAATTIDGTAYDLADGQAVRNINGLGPELELNGTGGAGGTDGLTATGAGTVVHAMAINRFPRDGVRLDGAGGHTVTGSYIGTNAVGTAALANGSNGIQIVSDGNTIGGTAGAATRNVLSGNPDEGVDIDPTYTGNVVIGNYIGTNAAGDGAIQNGAVSWSGGVLIDGDGNTVGGDTAAERNIISGNAPYGVVLAIGTNNTVSGNYIGIAADGITPLPNSTGIAIVNGTTNNTVGGLTVGERNVISGNTDDGIFIQRNDTTGNLIVGNHIGTAVSGAGDLGNGNNGIYIDGSPGNTIGGLTANHRNVVSGNDNNGILLDGADATGNTIQGNYFGLNAAGDAAVPNSDEGVDLSDAPGNLVGGNAVGAGNVISGNGQDGVLLIGAGSTGNFVSGNSIGTNAAGDAAVANGRAGVYIDNAATANDIGGPTAAWGNVISGNTEDGIYLTDSGTDLNRITHNYIGTNAAGDAAVPNGDRGVQVESGASSNWIGDVGQGNVISGNTGDGIIIADWLSSGTANNRIIENLVGVAADGTTPLGNGANGVHIDPVANTLIATNTIAHNAWDGVLLEPTSLTGNSIVGNSIYANGQLGIDLGNDGPTINDVGDADPGPNDLLNYPVIDSAVIAPPWITVNYTVDAPPGNYVVEFYSNPSGVDPSGYGEGEALEYQDSIAHPGGSASYVAVFSGFITDELTATLTEGVIGTYGSTSEFSPVAPVTAAVIVVNSGGNSADATPGDAVCDTGGTIVGGDPECTLDAAIQEANALGGSMTIEFAIPDTDGGYQNLGAGASYWRIRPAASLTTISATGVIIDATTQASYATGQGYFVNDLGPEIELDGSLAGGIGLNVTGGNAEIRGFIINRFVTGIALVGGDGNTIAGNYIGTGVDGVTGSVGNTDEGILIDQSANNVIGGPGGGDRNIVSGNRQRGITIDDWSDGAVINAGGTQILNNYIGADRTGLTTVSFDGVNDQQIGVYLLDTGDTTIGTAATGNLISGNSWYAIYAWGPDSANNVIQNNVMGLDRALTNPIPNGYEGPTRGAIFLSNSPGWLVGGTNPGEGNVIAGNGFYGIVAMGAAAIDNAIIGNAIYENGDLGIDLDLDGVTPNDPGDTLPGSNDLRNFPAITEAREIAGTVTVDFDLDVPAGNYRIEFFSNPSGADPSGYGEGEQLVHSYSVVAHPGGSASYTTTYSGAAGDVLTATTTEDLGGGYGSTSEFSAEHTVRPQTPPTANDDAYGTLEDTPLSVAAPGVLGNDSDAELDPMTATLVASPGSAQSFTLNPDGSFDYTPLADFNGIDTFTYRAYDGTLFSGTATVTITVTAVNDEPGFTTGGDVTVLEDSGAYLGGWASGLTAGPADEAGQALTFSVTNNTNPGLFAAGPVVTSGGTLSFTPAADQFGSADITVDLSDDGGVANGGDDTSAPVVFTITVDPVNDEPGFTTGGDVTVLEDSGPYLALWASGISTGPANEVTQNLTFNVTNNTNPGLFAVTPAVTPGGTLTFTPAANANGSADITLELSDDGGTANGGDDTSPPVVFTITVDPVNDPPTAVDDADTTLEDTAAFVDVLANDSDIDLDGLTVDSVTQGANGTVTNNGTDVTYDPDPDWNGIDTFTYTITDGNGEFDTATVTITVAPVNDEPGFITGGNVAVLEDSGAYLALWASGISTGPADEVTQNLTFTVTNNTNPGLFAVTPAVTPGGTLTFTPAADANGSADITIELSDDGGTANGGDDTSPPVVFTITVDPVNDPPTAVDDAYGTLEDTPLTVAAPGVLGNDTDIDSGGLTATLVAPPGSAQSFTLNPDGSFYYTPLPDFNGTDTFTYRAFDGGLLSNTATVTITVTTTADPPVLDPIGGQSVDEGTLLGFVATASDPDSGDTLTFSLSGEPAGASITAGGAFTWTPTETQGPGSYTFDVIVTDDSPGTLTDTETITVSVAEANLPPVVTNPGDQANAEGDAVILAVAVADPDLPANTITWSASGLPGGLTINPATGQITGTIDYDASASSPFSVTVTATDDGSPPLQDVVAFTWTVANTNRSPIALPDAAATNEDTPLTVDVLANDSDPDGDSLSILAVTQPPNGTVVNNGTDVTYTPDPDWHGTDTFTVTITDGTAPSAAAVTMTVAPVNDAPTLDPIGNQTVVEGSALVFTATASDVDTADALTFRLSGAPAGATISPAGGFTWTPTEAQGPATYTFDVIVEDDGTPVRSDAETITVTVTEQNSGPVIDPVAAITAAEETLIAFTATAVDVDIPIEPLTFSLSSAPAGASIDPATGAFTWTPTEAQGPGTYTFDVAVSDPGGAMSTTAVSITVDEVNRDPVVSAIADQVQAEGDGITLFVAATDPDLPANTLTWTAVGLPAGLAIDSATGEISGVVAVGTVGTYTTVVTVTDGAGGLGTTTFGWTVVPGVYNSAPNVANDSYKVFWTQPLQVPAPGVLANDTDTQGHSMTARIRTWPDEGSLSFLDDGSFTFIPGEVYVPVVRFTYDAVDERGAAATGTVTIRIVNRPPVAVDDTEEIYEDSVVVLSPLLNDEDADGDVLNLTDASPSAGSVLLLDDGLIEFTPPPEFSGEITIDYTVSDPGGETDDGVITITVLPLNDPPVANPDRRWFDDHGEHLIDVIKNDDDVEEDPITIWSISPPQHGTARIVNGELIAYDPDNGFVGADTILYTITDGNGGYASAELTIVLTDTVLGVAIERGAEIGIPAVPSPPLAAPQIDGETAPQGSFVVATVTLMTEAFFQTIDALELPLFLLFIMILAMYVFARITHTPFLGGTRRHTFAAVLLGREDNLEVRPEPLEHAPVIYRDLPAVRGVDATGRTRQSDGLSWMQIETPAGKGWVPSMNLMVERDLESFMNDRRPVELLSKLAAGFDRKGSLNKVISPRGLVVALGGGVIRYTKDEILELAGGASQTEGMSMFRREISEPFLSAHRATPHISPQTPHSATALLPTECRNFLYLSLEPDAAGRPWLVFFEYVKDKPYVVGLGVDA